MQEDFSTHFSSALIYRDLHCVQDLARTLKGSLFTGSIAKEIYGMTFKKDEDGLDFSAIYKLMKEY